MSEAATAGTEADAGRPPRRARATVPGSSSARSRSTPCPGWRGSPPAPTRGRSSGASAPGLKAGRRLTEAALSGEGPVELFEEARDETVEALRRLLGIVEGTDPREEAIAGSARRITVEETRQRKQAESLQERGAALFERASELDPGAEPDPPRLRPDRRPARAGRGADPEAARQRRPAGDRLHTQGGAARDRRDRGRAPADAGRPRGRLHAARADPRLHRQPRPPRPRRDPPRPDRRRDRLPGARGPARGDGGDEVGQLAASSAARRRGARST